MQEKEQYEKNANELMQMNKEIVTLKGQLKKLSSKAAMRHHDDSKVKKYAQQYYEMLKKGGHELATENQTEYDEMTEYQKEAVEYVKVEMQIKLKREIREKEEKSQSNINRGDIAKELNTVVSPQRYIAGDEDEVPIAKDKSVTELESEKKKLIETLNSKNTKGEISPEKSRILAKKIEDEYDDMISKKELKEQQKKKEKTEFEKISEKETKNGDVKSEKIDMENMEAKDFMEYREFLQEQLAEYNRIREEDNSNKNSIEVIEDCLDGEDIDRVFEIMEQEKNSPIEESADFLHAKYQLDFNGVAPENSSLHENEDALNVNRYFWYKNLAEKSSVYNGQPTKEMKEEMNIGAKSMEKVSPIMRKIFSDANIGYFENSSEGEGYKANNELEKIIRQSGYGEKLENAIGDYRLQIKIEKIKKELADLDKYRNSKMKENKKLDRMMNESEESQKSKLEIEKVTGEKICALEYGMEYKTEESLRTEKRQLINKLGVRKLNGEIDEQMYNDLSEKINDEYSRLMDNERMRKKKGIEISNNTFKKVGTTQSGINATHKEIENDINQNQNKNQDFDDIEQ